mmetsp:Transcript_46135/g.151108  ORF Transcript_46135/g.151108 Transcript_46135/m.151108 type:complete len:221 (-) Transcript_46135:462-1124(-)
MGFAAVWFRALCVFCIYVWEFGCVGERALYPRRSITILSLIACTAACSKVGSSCRQRAHAAARPHAKADAAASRSSGPASRATAAWYRKMLVQTSPAPMALTQRISGTRSEAEPPPARKMSAGRGPSVTASTHPGRVRTVAKSSAAAASASLLSVSARSSSRLSLRMSSRREARTLSTPLKPSSSSSGSAPSARARRREQTRSYSSPAPGGVVPQSANAS